MQNFGPVRKLFEAMKNRNFKHKANPGRVKREKDPIPWRYCILTLVCGLLLVVGFFWAARQHFSAMNLGIRNAKLRQQKEGLEAEARRLYLSKEISLSPSEIKKAARKLGLREITAQSFAILNPYKGKETVTNPNQRQAPTDKENEFKPDSAPKIEKTALVEKSDARTKDGKNKGQNPSDLNFRTQIAKK